MNASSDSALNREFESKDFTTLLNLIYKSGLVSKEELETFRKAIYQVREEQQKQEKTDTITDKNGDEYIIRKCPTQMKSLVGQHQSFIKYEILDNAGNVIGRVKLSSVGNPSTAEIEYYIDNDQFKDKGLASKAVEYVVSDVYAKGILDRLNVSHKGKNITTSIGEIFLSINDENKASQCVARKNGFTGQQTNNGQLYTLSKNDYFDNIKLSQQAEERTL